MAPWVVASKSELAEVGEKLSGIMATSRPPGRRTWMAECRCLAAVALSSVPIALTGPVVCWQHGGELRRVKAGDHDLWKDMSKECGAGRIKFIEAEALQGGC